ncbi:MAG: hypothetical protein U0939_02180 [Pirellulales bacterium]
MQLVWVAPAAFVQLLAIALGFVNMDRATRPALLLVAAGSVLLVSSLGGVLVRSFLFSNANLGPGNSTHMMFTALNVIQSIVTLAGYSTIVIAVFLDRAPAANHGGGMPPPPR